MFNMTQRRKILTVSGVALTLTLIIVFGVYETSRRTAAANDPRQEAFIASKWQEGSDHRFAMVSDLLKKHKIIGISEQELYTLLGKPDWDQSSDHWISYSLGAIGKDSETRLDIHLEHGKVDKFQVNRDT